MKKEQLKAKLEELTTLVEVMANAATAADEANAHCETTKKQVFTAQMVKPLNEFIYNTIWAAREAVKEIKELANTPD